MTGKKDNPTSYTAPHDVYTQGQYFQAGKPFVTAAPKGDKWEEITPKEMHAIEGSTNQIAADAPLEDLGVEALKAVAVTKHVNVTGMGKKELIAAIKAADEPRL